MIEVLVSIAVLGVSWDINEVAGDKVYVSFSGQKIVITADDFEERNISLGERDKLFEVLRRSRVFLEKQFLRKPTIYKKLILDEESKIFVFKDGITFYYGQVYLNIPNIEKEGVPPEPEKINFFRTPFFLRLLKGEVFIMSGDAGYFIYCIKCEGELWREHQKVIEKKLPAGEMEERASKVKAISSQEVIFVSDSDYESDIGDEELRKLVIMSVERMKTKDKFRKDIIYSHSTDVPSPKIPKSKKFDVRARENTGIPEMREMMLIEKRCYDLLRRGKPCR